MFVCLEDENSNCITQLPTHPAMATRNAESVGAESMAFKQCRDASPPIRRPASRALNAPASIDFHCTYLMYCLLFLPIIDIITCNENDRGLC